MNKIIIYTQPDCPPCTFSKQYFKENGYLFEEKDITKDPQAKKELVHKYQALSTPTFIINEQIIYGFDVEKIEAALNR